MIYLSTDSSIILKQSIKFNEYINQWRNNYREYIYDWKLWLHGSPIRVLCYEAVSIMLELKFTKILIKHWIAFLFIRKALYIFA